MNENDQQISDESLKKLQKRLYKQGEEFTERASRPELHIRSGRVPTEWSHEDQTEESKQKKIIPRRKISLLALFLVVSGIAAFGIVAFTVWYVIYGGGGSISVKGIEIKIESSTEAAGGDLMRWDVTVSNTTSRDLEIADLIFRYPDDSRPVLEEDRALLRKRIELGKIPAGESTTRTFEAFIFGEEGSRKQASAILEYRISGSNVILSNESIAEVLVTKAPLTVSIKAPRDVNSGDEISLEVEIISQAKDILDEAVLEVTYPEGFSFQNAKPAASFGNNRWVLGNIRPNEKRRIIVQGVLTAPDLEERFFRAEVGKLENNRISVLYGGSLATITLERPFLDFSFIVGESRNIIRPNGFGGVEIKWKNNLPVAVQNAILRVRIEGRGIDESSILVEKGFYRGTDKTVIWNASSYPAFSFVEPGEEGVVRFQFNVPGSFSMQSPADANITVKFTGTFEALDRPPGFSDIDISTTREHELRVVTNMQVVRKGLYYVDSLPGSGPLPPKVGQETVYTISWVLINSTNEVKNVKVEAALPAYMVWKGVVDPPDSRLVYNDLSGKITWNLDSIPAGTGMIYPSKEVRFQVGFTPVPGDVGRTPIIVSEVVAEGEDSFTQVRIRDTEPAQTIDLRGSDPKFKRGQGVIVQ